MPFHRRDLLWGGKPSYSQKLINLFGSSIVGYWPLGEPNGSVSTDIGGRNHPGAYTAVTLGQPGIGDGNTAASFDGAASFDNVYSAGLNTDFNNQEGTMAIWVKVASAGVWTDGFPRYAFVLWPDGSNGVKLFKDSTNNLIVCRYSAGGVSNSANIGISSVGWIHIAMTWSKSGDAVKGYINGVQSGATLNGLGVWAGVLDPTTSVIGANSTAPISVWSGLLAHALLLNRPATAAEALQMATVP